MQETKNQSIQIDPRPKLIPWKNSCRFCNTQMHATKEYHRRNFFKVDKSTQFPPPVPPRNSSTFSRLFPLFSRKLPRSLMNFLNQLASRVYLILIPLFFSEAEKYFIYSQFSHSSGIYFERISKVRLFSEKYHFISYIDIFQPDVLKYNIIDNSHKLYEYYILSNIANSCNLYGNQTKLDFIEQ